MFNSLHMKLVLVLVLLVISVMAVVGTFLINSLAQNDVEDFLAQMSDVFTPEFILNLERTAAEGSPSALRNILEAYTSPLGINENRMFFILDGASGEYILGSDDERGSVLPLSSNILTAMNGSVGQTVDRLSDSFDIAVPLRSQGGGVLYIVGVSDNKAELEKLTWDLLSILIRAIFFGLIVAILLSFLLSKAITNPIERLTEQATHIAAGDFESRAEASSTDEIGMLTQTFNEMAETLGQTLREVGEERNKLDTLFRHMADGVVAFNGAGKLLHVNPAAQQMLGKELAADMTFADVFPNTQIKPDDLREDGHFVELEYIAGAHILKIFLAPITVGEDGQGVMAVLHDITEQQKLDDSRREFVANVSHELRTPLTNIKSYTETLIDTGDEIDPETRRSFLDVVYNESDRMTRIVKDLLTLSRLDSNHMEMQMCRLDLIAAANAAVQSMRIEADTQKITLISSLPASLPAIRGDKERIQQVIINIISNAIKYNRQNGEVRVTGGEDGSNVFIRVADTGLGIPAQDLPRIFERFYRVDKARSRKRGGTGLGLAIAKEIVESHGGKITFDSVYGKGSTVTLSFPVCAGGDADD